MRAGVLSFVVLSSSVSSALAQDASQIAGTNFAHEHMICSAYYSITAECVLTRPDLPGADDLATRLRGVAETLFGRGVEFGKVAGVSQKAGLARLELALSDMMADMDQSCANIAVLNVKNAEPCRFLSEHPSERLGQLLPE